MFNIYRFSINNIDISHIKHPSLTALILSTDDCVHRWSSCRSDRQV